MEEFIELCESGNLDGIKNYYQEKMYLEDHDCIFSRELNEYAFRCACRKGRLDVAQWLLSVKPTINISANNEYIFRIACQNGHLDVAQWLLSVKPNINISAKDEYAFRHACVFAHMPVIHWFMSIDASYNAKINENSGPYISIISTKTQIPPSLLDNNDSEY